MNKSILAFFITLQLMAAAIPANAEERAALSSPQSGVLCDNYLCASADGVSRTLTEKNLGTEVAAKLFSQGDFNLSEFTFAN